MSDEEDAELTAAAIARLAGVGRAAVSNWRRRYPQFPKPVGGSESSPTFSRAEVEAWLSATGKADQLATAGRTATGTQRVTDSLAAHEDAKVLASDAYGAALLPGRWPEPTERSLPDLSPGELLAKVMVSILPRSTAAAEPVSADDADAPVVLDPACSDATLLLAVADRFGNYVRLAGQEIRPAAADAAALNLRLHSRAASYEIHTGDSLLDDRLRTYLGAAAAVVCEPPFDQPQWPAAELTADPRWEFGIPAPRDGELAWVQHCYAHLRPRGVAVVAVTPRTCVQVSGQHIRAALVRSGVLRDVIALPKAMGSQPDTDPYLWVLQRPYGASRESAVRMVDLSGVGDAGDVPRDFAAWERLFEDADPTICRAVPRLELLDGDVNLLPSRHVAARVETSADDLARATARLEALYARIGHGLPHFAAPKNPLRHGYVTLAELERVGALTIRSRETTPRAGDLLVLTLGRPLAVATGTAADDVGVAQVVEIDETRLDAHFVATFLRADAHALPVANTLGALSREDLRRCRIPRMPLAEQRRYGDAFRRLQGVRQALTELATLSTKVIDQTVYGLTTGALEPPTTKTRSADSADETDDEMREQ